MMPKSKSELAAQFLLKKDNTEAIFKNLKWLFAAAGLIAVANSAFHHSYTYVVIVSVLLFFLLMLLSISHGMNYVVIPLVEAVFPKWDIKKTREQNERRKGFWRKTLFALKTIFLTKHGITYFVLSLGYMYYAMQLVDLAIKYFPVKAG